MVDSIHHCCIDPFARNWQCLQCSKSVPTLDDFPVLAPMHSRADDGFDPEYFNDLFHCEANHFWFRARNRLIVRVCKRFLGKRKTWLEIGCGTGFVLQAITKAFPDVAVFGSEILVDGLSYTRRRCPDARLFQMDARNIPFRNCFDVIGAFDVLEHIEEDELVLRNLAKALTPEGLVILTVPQHPTLWSAVDDYACHKRRYKRTELAEKLAMNGFKVLYSTSFVSLLLPLLYLSRSQQKRSQQTAHDFDPLQEFRIHSWLNRLLYVTLCLEQAGMGLGIRYPLGGSRLVVAQKL